MGFICFFLSKKIYQENVILTTINILFQSQHLNFRVTLTRLSEISEKMEHICKVIFDSAFTIQSHAESMKKSWEPFRIYQPTSTANLAIICPNGLVLAVLVSWQILNGSQDFLHTFSMAFYHKWDVSLISDSLGSVSHSTLLDTKIYSL